MTTIKTLVNAIANIIFDNNNVDIDNVINTVATDNNVSTDNAKNAFLLFAYHSISATDKYIIVATDKNNDMYMNNYTMNDLLDFDCFNSSYDSHYKTTTIRLKVSNNLKKDILSNGIKIGDSKEIEWYKKTSGYNNGQLAEQFVKMFYNVAYQRDNLAFYYFGDIEINYNTYQIKSHKATFCNEKQIRNYVAKYGYTRRHIEQKYKLTVDDTEKAKIIDLDKELDKIYEKAIAFNDEEVRYYTLCSDIIKNYLFKLYQSFMYDKNKKAFMELKGFCKINKVNFINLAYILCHLDD